MKQQILRTYAFDTCRIGNRVALDSDVSMNDKVPSDDDVKAAAAASGCTQNEVALQMLIWSQSKRLWQLTLCAQST